MPIANHAVAARTWADFLGRARALESFHAIYGTDSDVLDRRLELLRRVIGRFVERFGDRPIRLFRSPGRINLRGMHVDTHGGYLNLMTHQREAVVAVADHAAEHFEFANVDPSFGDATFSIHPLSERRAFGRTWLDFIADPAVRSHVEAHRGAWGHYVCGAMLRARFARPACPLPGLVGVLGSDIPRGAALSSSSAICVALVLAATACAGRPLEGDALITAARDAEWFTGSRCGLGDQAAMVLPKRGELVNVAFRPEAFDTAAARPMAFPDSARVLVIDSGTTRSLSGAALVEYTRNRFAYSLALSILRQEAARDGLAPEVVAQLNSLARVSPHELGADRIYAWLRRVPESLGLDELRRRYDLPDLDEAYGRYFGTVDPARRPTSIHLRGPLLFGIAESERARTFGEAVASGDLDRAGALMTTGHDGDRRIGRDGTAFACDVSDAAIEALAAAATPIEQCPGAYGASSPVLDALVDAALSAGALGASLTGAGIAGAVLALCRAEDAPRVAEGVRACLASTAYAALTGRNAHPERRETHDAVVTNEATASACELTLPQ
ncbi:MAG TPA: galactokinase family protein [Candidatus Hydrogenedentes bacterium]|nr:galactokinase family protein [Candidatus Hydrogenedentota bacterium]HPG68438.1 galactokinase family protein [Candidatus Hydrogenedentota bacterium]